MTTTTTRRALLSGAAALPLAVRLPAPAQAGNPAGAATDRIFDLIARQQRTAAAWAAFQPETDPPRDDELQAADAAALETLLRTAPTTLAGVCAALRYVEAYCNRHGFGPFADFADGPAHEIADAGARFLSTIAMVIETIEGRAAA